MKAGRCDLIKKTEYSLRKDYFRDSLILVTLSIGTIKEDSNFLVGGAYDASKLCGRISSVFHGRLSVRSDDAIWSW